MVDRHRVESFLEVLESNLLFLESRIVDELSNFSLVVGDFDPKLQEAQELEWPPELEPGRYIGFGCYRAMQRKNSTSAAYIQKRYEEAARDITGNDHIDFLELIQTTRQEAFLVGDFLNRELTGTDLEQEILSNFESWIQIALTRTKQISDLVEPDKLSEVASGISSEEARRSQATLKVELNKYNNSITELEGTLERNFVDTGKVFYEQFLSSGLSVSAGGSASEAIDSYLTLVIEDQRRRIDLYRDKTNLLIDRISSRGSIRRKIQELAPKGKSMPTDGPGVMVRDASVSLEERQYWGSLEATDDFKLLGTHDDLPDLDKGDPHSQYLLRAGGTLEGDTDFVERKTIDGVDLDQHRHRGTDGSPRIHGDSIIRGTLKEGAVNTDKLPVKPQGLTVSRMDLNTVPPGMTVIDTFLEWDGDDQFSHEIEVRRVETEHPLETVLRYSEPFNSGQWALGQLIAPLSEGYFITYGEDPNPPYQYMSAFRIDTAVEPADVVEVDRISAEYGNWINTGFVQTAQNHVVLFSYDDAEDWLIGFKFDPATETLTAHPNPDYESPHLDAGRDNTPRSMPVGRSLGGGKGVIGLSVAYDSIPDPWNFDTLDFSHDSGHYNASTNPEKIFSGMEDIVFKPDGTKCWVMRGSNRIIYSWELTTPWDLRTTVRARHNDPYMETLHTNYDPPGNSLGEQDVGSIAIKPDGTRFYGLREGTNGGLNGAPPAVIQWDTTTPWVFQNGNSSDPEYVPTASQAGIFDVSAQVTTATGLDFKPDGTRMYVLENSYGSIHDERIYQYDLSTPWDVTTATYAGVSPAGVSLSNGDERGLRMRSDGEAAFVLNASNSYVFQWHVPTPWDVTSMTGSIPPGQSTSYATVNQHTPAGGFWLRPDGAMMFVVRQDNFRSYDTVSRYDLGEPREDYGVHFVSWHQGEHYPSIDHYHAIEDVAIGNINETALDTFNDNEIMVAVPLSGDVDGSFFTVDPVSGPQLITGPFNDGNNTWGNREYCVVDGKVYWWGYISGSNASHILSRAPDGEFQVVYTEDDVDDPGYNVFQAPLKLDNGSLATMQTYYEDGPRNGYNAILMGNDEDEEELPLTDEELFFVEPFPGSWGGFLYGASPACDPVPAGGVLWHKVGWDNYEDDNNFHQMRFISIGLERATGIPD